MWEKRELDLGIEQPRLQRVACTVCIHAAGVPVFEEGWPRDVVCLPTHNLVAPYAAAAKMKVIFLDVDGVICCNAEGELEHSKLLRLKRVADETGAKIVISSDWRRHPHLLAQLVDVLTNEYGMSCIGATPAGPPDLAMRPSEIYTWLKSWNEQATSVDKVTSYVAVDDRDLATEMGGDKLMRGRMLLTVYEDGLTDEIARRMAEKLLESDAQTWRHRAAPQPIVARGLSPPLGRPARRPGPPTPPPKSTPPPVRPVTRTSAAAAAAARMPTLSVDGASTLLAPRRPPHRAPRPSYARPAVPEIYGVRTRPRPVKLAPLLG